MTGRTPRHVLPRTHTHTSTGDRWQVTAGSVRLALQGSPEQRPWQALPSASCVPLYHFLLAPHLLFVEILALQMDYIWTGIIMKSDSVH